MNKNDRHEPADDAQRQLIELFRAGRLAEFEALAEALIAQNRNRATVAKMLGAVLLVQGKDAVAVLRMAAELSPDDPDTLNNLATAQARRGLHSDAAATCRRALRLRPDFPEAHNNLGNALHQLGEHEAAIAGFRRALELKPAFDEAHNNLGIALQALHRPEEAIPCYRQALALRPRFAEAHNNLGNALRSLGRFEEAAACYEDALRVRPDFAAVYNNLGVAQHELGRHEAALASYRHCLALDPTYARAHCNLGNALRKLGQFDAAIGCFREAVAWAPDYAEAHGDLAHALLHEGRPDEALASFREQLRCDPDNVDAAHHVAALSGGPSERAPAEYVEKLFDAYAGSFDSHLQGVLKYDVPRTIASLIAQRLGAPQRGRRVLDLGCGTGLVGEAFAGLGLALTGVDLSRKMLDRARDRGRYERLEHGDVLAVMRSEPTARYDFIVAADVFIYLGRLDDVFVECARLLAGGGVMAFSVESPAGAAGGDGYRLEKNTRYSHDAGYIDALAEKSGFATIAAEPTTVREHGGERVEGRIFVLVKGETRPA